MITDSSIQPSLLDQGRDNWSSFSETFKQYCLISGGTAGRQIVTGTLIPLKPFSQRPTKNDLELSQHGKPIPDQYVYSRKEFPDSDLSEIPLIDQSLSDFSKRELREDIAIYEKALATFVLADNLLLNYMYTNISASSLILVKAHKHYPEYYALPDGERSYAFFEILKFIHCIGNAATKLSRLKTFTQMVQGGDSHEEYLSRFNALAPLVRSDLTTFEKPQDIHADSLFVLIYLAGLNKDLFRQVLDQLLASNPSGHFDNLYEVKNYINDWKTARNIGLPSSDEFQPSIQGQADLTAGSSNTSSTKTNNFKTNYNTHCKYCLLATNHLYNNHLSDHCGRNPNRAKGPPPTSEQFNSTYVPEPAAPSSASSFHVGFSNLGPPATDVVDAARSFLTSMRVDPFSDEVSINLARLDEIIFPPTTSPFDAIQ